MLIRRVALGLVVVASLAPIVVAKDSASKLDREAVARAVRSNLQDVRSALAEARNPLHAWEEKGDAQEAGGALIQLREARRQLDQAIGTLEVAEGKPSYTYRLTDTTWKWRTRMQEVLVRQPNGRITKVKKPKKSGGWFTIKGKLGLALTYQPVRLAKVEIRIRGMEGFKHVYDWDAGRSVKMGSETKVPLQIAVFEEQMGGFWLRKAKDAEVQREIEVRVVYVRYEDGTEKRWR